MANDPVELETTDPLELLGTAVAAVTAVAASDPRRLGDLASIQALHRTRASLDGALALACSAFDRSGAYADHGAANAATFLSIELHSPKGDVRRSLRLGGGLADLPRFSASWLDGEITGGHVGVVVEASSPRTKDALRRDEDLLLDQARKLRFPHFCRAVAYWSQQADPDGAEESAEANQQRRAVHLDQSFQGMYLGKITLDPLSGAIVDNELRRLYDEAFQKDWVEARERLGRDPRPDDLTRSPAQRRADSLVEMARRSASTPMGCRHPRPLFTVLVDYPTLAGRICELANGTVITPGSLVPYLDEATIERAVFAPGRRLEIGERSRLFKGATRRAIEIRDRSCAHPYCDRPADICQGDHIVPYSQGGPTTQENGRLLCSFHNRLRLRSEPASVTGPDEDLDSS